MRQALDAHFARYSRPRTSGMAALAPGRFNLKQAWHAIAEAQEPAAT